MQVFILTLALVLSLLYLGKRLIVPFFKKDKACESCALHQQVTKESK